MEIFAFDESDTSSIATHVLSTVKKFSDNSKSQGK
jgi:hypothetical protein